MSRLALTFNIMTDENRSDLHIFSLDIETLEQGKTLVKTNFTLSIYGANKVTIEGLIRTKPALEENTIKVVEFCFFKNMVF